MIPTRQSIFVLLMSICWWGVAGNISAQQDFAKSSVSKLLEDLKSESRATRAQAEQALINLGETALEQLPLTGGQSPDAVNDALQRIRRQIESNAAQSTLQGQSMTVLPENSLQGVLEALMRESGSRIMTGGVPADLQQFPGTPIQQTGTFFELLDKNLDAGGFGWRWGRDLKSMEVTPNTEGLQGVEASYVHGFRSKLLEVKSQRNFVDPEERTIYRLLLALDTDPRMKPSWLNVVESELTITSPECRLELLNPLARREVSAVGQRCQFPVDFAASSKSIPGFVGLQAQVSLRVAIRQKVLVFTQKDLGNALQEAGPMRLGLDHWSEHEDGLDVILRIEFTTLLPELESHRQGALHRDVAVKLSNGITLKSSAVELLESDGAVHRVQYRFRTRDNLAGAELSYGAPTLITDLPLSFQLDNIPLPTE